MPEPSQVVPSVTLPGRGTISPPEHLSLATSELTAVNFMLVEGALLRDNGTHWQYNTRSSRLLREVALDRLQNIDHVRRPMK
jgi:hypothetical protein